MIFSIKIKDLTNLPISFPNNETTIFKISGNYEEIIERIMNHDQDDEFKSITVRDGQIVNGIIRYNAILSLINDKFDHKGVLYSDFSKEQWDAFNSFVFNVDFDNTDIEEATELFKKINHISM